MLFGSAVEPTFFSQKHHRAGICILITVNILSMMAALNLVVVLNPEDRISAKRGGALTCLGLVYFVSLFELLNVLCLYTAAGSSFRHKYSLSCGDVLDITNKLVSGVQAVFCAATGGVVCMWSCRRDFLRSSHYMSEGYAWFGAAYFFYDIWSMYMVHIQMNSPGEYAGRKLRRPNAARRVSFLSYCAHEPMILFHHLFIGGFGFLVIVYLRGDLGDCTFGVVYLMELSTPFVSLRGILSRLKLKSSRAYIVNGLLMLGTFFVCRVASLPYVCLVYSRELGVSYIHAVKSLPLGCQLSILALLVPQMYWFSLMSAGALKIFFPPSDKNSNKASDKNANRSSNKLAVGDTDKRS